MTIPSLATARLLLEPVRLSDAADLHRLWTDADVRRYLFDDVVIPESRARELVEASLKIAGEKGLGMWRVSRRETPDELVGFVSLKHPAGSSEVEILYGLHPSLWGLGLATEATEAALDYAFSTLGISRVIAGANPPNERSFMVMRRLGMSPLEEEIPSAPGVLHFFVDRERFQKASRPVRIS